MVLSPACAKENQTPGADSVHSRGAPRRRGRKTGGGRQPRTKERGDVVGLRQQWGEAGGLCYCSLFLGTFFINVNISPKEDIWCL